MSEAEKDILASIEDTTDLSAMFDDSGINIWIDKYSDVFSGFDTRPLDKRRLSNDFITEIAKMVREEAGAEVFLKFNILDDKADKEIESIITGHLKAHFTTKRNAELESIRRTSRKGYILTLSGFFLIIGLAYVSSIGQDIFLLNSLPALTEPLAWFMTWTGLDHIFKHYGNDNGTLDVNSRMLRARINFFCMGAAAEADAETEATEVEAATVVQKPRKVIPAGNNLRIA